MRFSCAKPALAAMLALLVSGCATAVVGEKIEGPRATDIVHTVTAAYQRDSGDVLICVTGSQAGSADSTPIDEFSINLPVARYASRGDEGPELRIEPRAILPIYDVSYDDIGGPCPKRRAARRLMLKALPIEKVSANKIRNPHFLEKSNENLRAVFRNAPFRRTIHVVGDTGNKYRKRPVLIAYQQDSPIFGGAHGVEISTRRERYYSGKYTRKVFWIAAFPVALAVDAVTFPIQFGVLFYMAWQLDR